MLTLLGKAIFVLHTKCFAMHSIFVYIVAGSFSLSISECSAVERILVIPSYAVRGRSLQYILHLLLSRGLYEAKKPSGHGIPFVVPSPGTLFESTGAKSFELRWVPEKVEELFYEIISASEPPSVDAFSY